MSSFCGSDNDENDYEIGYREGGIAALGVYLMAEAIRLNHLGIRPVRFTTQMAPPITFDFDLYEEEPF